MKKFVGFCRECVAELGKVVWPSREEAAASVKVVLVSTIICALLLGVLDWMLTEGLRIIF